MHPDDGRRVARLFLPRLLLEEFERVDGLLGELLVDLDVSPPVVGDEGGPVGHRVEQRPERAIATAVIVAVEELRLRVDGDDLRRTVQ